MKIPKQILIANELRLIRLKEIAPQLDGDPGNVNTYCLPTILKMLIDDAIEMGELIKKYAEDDF